MAIDPGKIRCVSIAHIVTGSLLIICGVVQLVRDMNFLWTDTLYFGIWTGTWMCLTGIMGIIASFRIPAFTGIFLASSVVSSLFALAIMASYAYAAATIHWELWIYRNFMNLAISSIAFVLGIVELIIGIWAAIYGCEACCDNTPEEQVVLASNPVVPVAYPVQAGGAMAAAQAIQRPIMMLPTSRNNGRTGLFKGCVTTASEAVLDEATDHL